MDVLANVTTDARVAPTYVEVFQVTFLQGVRQLGFAGPLFGVFTVSGVNAVATDIAVHKGQARYAEAGEVVVVAHLPGALIWAVEAADELRPNSKFSLIT